jgi:hypothetical protein
MIPGGTNERGMKEIREEEEKAVKVGNGEDKGRTQEVFQSRR